MNQLINKQSALLSLARLIERAAYYGIRTVLILYAIEVLMVEREVALGLYGWFTAAVYFCYLIGGLLGSLALKPKVALLIGGSFQTMGALALCIPNVNGLYIGGIFLALGTGLYSPNILSVFSHNFRVKGRDLSSGFNLIYLAVNLGAFAGIYLLGSIGEHYSYISSFLIGALLMAGSTILLYFSNIEDHPTEINPSYSLGSSMVVIPLMILVTVCFWGAYEIGGMTLVDITFLASDSSSYPKVSDAIENTNMITLSILGVGLFFIWHFVRLSEFVKVGLGFLVAAVGTYLLAMSYSSTTEINPVSIAIIYSILFSTAEILITPIILAIYTRAVHSKFVALILGVSFFFVAIGNKFFSAIFYSYQEVIRPASMLKITAGLLLIIAVIVGLLRFIIKEQKPSEEIQISDNDLLDS